MDSFTTAGRSPNPSGGPVAPRIAAAEGPTEASDQFNVGPLVIGTPSPSLEPQPVDPKFKNLPFRADTVTDGWSTLDLTVRGASVRGQYHRYNGAPRQDEFAVVTLSNGSVIAAVADGVSQAEQSHLGATTAVRYAIRWLADYEPDTIDTADWHRMAQEAAWALVEQAQAIYGLPEPDPVRAEKGLMCTLTCAFICPPDDERRCRGYVINIGDSGAWLVRADGFTRLGGGKDTDDTGFTSSAVSGLPRVPVAVEPVPFELVIGESLMLATDGIGDPLGDGAGAVGRLFHDMLYDSPPPSIIEFARAVDFRRERFDDDRTAVVAQYRIAGRT